MLAVINRIRQRLTKKTVFLRRFLAKTSSFFTVCHVGNGILSSHSNMADGEVGLSGEMYSDLPTLRSRQLQWFI